MARRIVSNPWFNAQLKSNGLNKTRLARAVGIHPSALSNILSGNRRLQLDEANKIAEALHRPVVEVLERFGISFGPGLGGSGLLSGQISSEDKAVFFNEATGPVELKYIDLSIGLFYSFLEFTTNEAAPRYFAGELIGIQEENDLDACLGAEAVVGLKDGTAVFKRVQPGSGPGLFTLISLNQSRPALIDVPLEWGYAVGVHVPINAVRSSDKLP